MSGDERGGLVAVESTSVEINTVIDKEAELRKTVIADLLRLGVVTIDESRLAGGVIIENLDFFRKKTTVKDPDTDEDLTAFDVMKRVPGPMKNGLGGQDSQKNYYHVFRNQKVITREDLESGRKSREMFFTLEDKNDLKDVDRLGDYGGKFYLLLPEVGGEFDVRKNFQPTREDGFDSGVDSFEANVLAMIYILGEGGRDADGELWVNKVGNPGVKEKLSGSWMSRMGFRTYRGMKWKDNPRRLIKEYGKGIDPNALRKEDFIERTKRKNIIGKNGQLMVDGTLIFFGRNRAGFEVVPLSRLDHLYVLRNGIEVDGVFDAGKGDDIVLRPLVIGSTIRGMRGGSYSERRLSSNKTLHRFDQNGVSEKLNVNTLKAAAGLLDLMDCVAQIDPESVKKLEHLTYDQQLHLLNGYLSLKLDGRREFEERIARGSAVSIEAMTYLSRYSGIENGGRPLTLPEGKLGESVLSAYCDVVKQLDHFRIGIWSRVGKDQDVHSQTTRQLSARVVEGVAYRIGSVFGKSKATNYNEVLSEITMLSRCLLAVNASLEGEEVKSRQIQKDESGKVTHLTLVYNFGEDDDSDKLFVTFRPDRVYGDSAKKGVGQPRIGFTFNSGGKNFNLRIDSDDNGLSVDVGSHGGKFAEESARVGLPHYTYGIIDQAYKSVFAGYVKRMAGLWGVPDSIWPQSRGVQ